MKSFADFFSLSARAMSMPDGMSPVADYLRICTPGVSSSLCLTLTADVSLVLMSTANTSYDMRAEDAVDSESKP